MVVTDLDQELKSKEVDTTSAVVNKFKKIAINNIDLHI